MYYLGSKSNRMSSEDLGTCAWEFWTKNLQQRYFLANGHSIETHVRPSFVMTLTLYPSSLQAKKTSYQIFGCVMWCDELCCNLVLKSIKSPLHVTVDWIHCIWQLAWRRKRLVLMQGWHLKRRSSDACYGLVHPSETKLYNNATTIKMHNYIVVLCAA